VAGKGLLRGLTSGQDSSWQICNRRLSAGQWEKRFTKKGLWRGEDAFWLPWVMRGSGWNGGLIVPRAGLLMCYTNYDDRNPRDNNRQRRIRKYRHHTPKPQWSVHLPGMHNMYCTVMSVYYCYWHDCQNWGFGTHNQLVCWDRTHFVINSSTHPYTGTHHVWLDFPYICSTRISWSKVDKIDTLHMPLSWPCRCSLIFISGSQVAKAHYHARPHWAYSEHLIV
jgi:hypothetical protein